MQSDVIEKSKKKIIIDFSVYQLSKMSQQKPQWLEMYNVDPTALQQSPIRLILKLGDDLRQDMITLRMFSLFEKVSWLGGCGS